MMEKTACLVESRKRSQNRTSNGQENYYSKFTKVISETQKKDHSILIKIHVLIFRCLIAMSSLKSSYILIIKFLFFHLRQDKV